MIDYETAKQNAIEYINKGSSRADHEALIIDDLTIEKEYGWIFFYNSRIYLETGNIHYSFIGNAPFIVEKEDGSFHYTGTARDTEYYITQYEKQRKWKKFWAKFSLFKRSQS